MIEGGSYVNHQKDTTSASITDPQKLCQATYLRTSDSQILYISQCLCHKSKERRIAYGEPLSQRFGLKRVALCIPKTRDVAVDGEDSVRRAH